jgi:hypothetical protein
VNDGFGDAAQSGEAKTVTAASADRHAVAMLLPLTVTERIGMVTCSENGARHARRLLGV